MRFKFLKKFLWLLNTLLVIGIVAYALRFFILGGPKKVGSRSPDKILGKLPVAIPQPESSKPAPVFDYRFIHELPISGDPPIIVVAPEGGNGENVPVSPLAQDYALSWMKLDPDLWQSFAQLEKIGVTPPVTIFVKVGEKVDGVWKLLEVTDRDATFEEIRSGKKVVLVHKKDAAKGLSAGPEGSDPRELPTTIGGPTGRPQKQPREAPTVEAIQIRENLWEVSPEESQWYGEYGEEIAEDIAVVPEKDPETGKPDGVRIKSIKEGSVLARRGLVPGDKIKSINGNPVTSRQEALAYVKGPGKGLSRYVVEIERKGRIIPITYNVKQ